MANQAELGFNTTLNRKINHCTAFTAAVAMIKIMLNL